MSRTVPITLILIGLVCSFWSPLVAEDDPRAAQKKRLEEAERELEAATEAFEEIRRELKRDFGIIRGDRWSKVAPKFEFAIEQEVEMLREDPKRDPVAGMSERLFDISIVSQVVNDRLAKAMEKAIRAAAAAEGEVDSATILADSLKVVFPEETFQENWDKHFMDLPHIARVDDAEVELDEAKWELEKPLLPTLPECDGPPGTVHVTKGKFTFGPWTGWEVDLKKNASAGVRMKGFYIHAFEVTNLQFLEFLEELDDAELVKKYLPTDFTLDEDGTISVSRKTWWYPVTGLTFTAASAYAESLGMRLPTEEEWEYAARGTDSFLYPWGKDYKKGFANSRERGLGRKANVGAHPKDKSPFGVYDMAGNVSEMTSNLSGRRSAYKKWEKLDDLIWRGGNYDESQQALQTTYRWTITVDGGVGDYIGFRCVVGEKEWKSKK